MNDNADRERALQQGPDPKGLRIAQLEASLAESEARVRKLEVVAEAAKDYMLDRPGSHRARRMLMEALAKLDEVRK